MRAWNHEVIEVGHDNVPTLIGIDIVAVQIAEAGAMGYHGGVFIVCADLSVYFTCYLKPSSYSGYSKYMSKEDLQNIFHPLKYFQPGIMGTGSNAPLGWQYYYLGMGNHLLIRDDYKKSFEKNVERLEKIGPDTILYNQWLEAILASLKPY